MERLDGEAIRAWAQAAATALHAARGTLDALNVFPVPDADTGTNLYLTLTQGADEVAALDADAPAGAVLAAFAHGTLVGARGNSGVIASQFLLGLARGFDDEAHDGEPIDAAAHDGGRLATALDTAQRAARTAVARPVDGTILTAATAAASAARAAADSGADLGGTVSAALGGAREALARTREELAVLRAAGVVDAGAAGLVVILEALVGVVTGGPASGGARLAAPDRQHPGAQPAATDGGAPGDEPPSDGEFEVMYLVESAAPDLAAVLSERLQQLGESVAVVGGPGEWQAHVHTDDPAAAVAAGALGTQRQITVRHLERHGPHGGAVGHPAPPIPGAENPVDGAQPPASELGLVVGTRSPALIRELARTGAIVMVLTGAPASAASVLRAVVDTGGTQVAVLPGSLDARTAALAAAAPSPEHAPATRAGRPEIQIHVLDAVDDARVVAGLAAAVAGRSAPPEDGDAGAGEPAGIPVERVALAAIRAAVEAVRTVEIEGSDVVAARAAADGLLSAGGEILTILRGAGADDVVLGALLEHLAQGYPELEVIVLEGGQLTPAVVLAVE